MLNTVGKKQKNNEVHSESSLRLSTASIIPARCIHFRGRDNAACCVCAAPHLSLLLPQVKNTAPSPPRSLCSAELCSYSLCVPAVKSDLRHGGEPVPEVWCATRQKKQVGINQSTHYCTTPAVCMYRGVCPEAWWDVRGTWADRMWHLKGPVGFDLGRTGESSWFTKILFFFWTRDLHWNVVEVFWPGLMFPSWSCPLIFLMIRLHTRSLYN